MSSELNKSTFLHNIYYQYLSISYKKALKILKNNDICLDFYAKDARRHVKTTTNTYNFVFLDAFTPAKCPSLWTFEFFTEIYNKLEDDGMVLTYSCSASIRNALIKNNFYVGKIYDENKDKYIGTIAAKNKKLIEHPLNKKDLALIHSRAGICYYDKDLSLDNASIINNHKKDVEQSDLISSSKALKGFKNGNTFPL